MGLIDSGNVTLTDINSEQQNTGVYYLVSIGGNVVKAQTDLRYSLVDDQFSYWEMLTYTFYDSEPKLNIPMVTDKVNVKRQNVQPSFVDTVNMVTFEIDSVEVLDIKDTINELSELTIRLTSKKRSK